MALEECGGKGVEEGEPGGGCGGHAVGEEDGGGGGGGGAVDFGPEGSAGGEGDVRRCAGEHNGGDALGWTKRCRE